jgi:hypothetical protein
MSYFWSHNLKERELLKDSEIDGRILLNWLFIETEGRNQSGGDDAMNFRFLKRDDIIN